MIRLRADLAGFLHGMQQHFERAACRAGVTRSYLRLGTRTVVLEFVGPGLGDRLTEYIVPMLQKPSTAPTTTLRVWDTDTTGVEPPPPINALRFRGWSKLPGVRFARCLVSNAIQIWPEHEPVAYCWMRSVKQLKSWIRAAPFREALSWWAEADGCAVAHASVVCGQRSGVLLVGRSGAGKSTTALACVNSKSGFVADDCVLLSPSDGCHATALYRTAKVSGVLLQGELRRLVGFDTCLQHDRGKSILAFPRDGWPLSPSCQIRAAVTLSVGARGTSRLRRVPPGTILRALAPSTLLQTPTLRQQSLDVLGNVVASVDCYQLEAGRELQSVAGEIEGLLS